MFVDYRQQYSLLYFISTGISTKILQRELTLLGHTGLPMFTAGLYRSFNFPVVEVVWLHTSILKNEAIVLLHSFLFQYLKLVREHTNTNILLASYRQHNKTANLQFLACVSKHLK